MTRATFESIPIVENDDPLVDLKEYPFVIEASYFNQGLSGASTLKLRKGVADKLAQIQQSFEGKYRFKIWDGHRPREVQDAIYNAYYKKLAQENPEWDEAELHYATEQFVTKATNRKRIPPHATGGAVDLTLVDEHEEELDMGTEFDFFGPEAAPFYFQDRAFSELIHGNRLILREAMIASGFTPDEDEWWHFDYGDQLWALRADKPEAFYSEAT
ncbi:MAG TPA: M15 family metallopeptidase [Candidatus Saccharimonadales bacterium]|nr:M15 family metallopeptidase [Candidatus Saccharimonadales bacterium]